MSSRAFLLLIEAEDDHDEILNNDSRFPRTRHTLPPVNRPLKPSDMGGHYRRAKEPGYFLPSPKTDKGPLARKSRERFIPHEGLTRDDLPDVYKAMIPQAAEYIQQNFEWFWDTLFARNTRKQLHPTIRTYGNPEQQTMRELQLLGWRIPIIGTFEKVSKSVRRKLSREERVYIHTREEDLKRMYFGMLLSEADHTLAVNYIVRNIKALKNLDGGEAR